MFLNGKVAGRDSCDGLFGGVEFLRSATIQGVTKRAWDASFDVVSGVLGKGSGNVASFEPFLQSLRLNRFE